MLPLAAYPIYLSVLAQISAKQMFVKLLRLSPFVFFVGAWNIFFDEGNIVIAGVWLPAGWLSFFTLALKFMLSVSAVVAMVSLTGFAALCRAVAGAGLPRILTDQVFLFYRYVKLVGDEARNIVRARVFRGGALSLGESGNILGPLALRCFARSRRIYDALECRGYDGLISNGKSARRYFKFSDRIFVTVWIFIFIAVRLNLPAIIGGFVLGK